MRGTSFDERGVDVLDRDLGEFRRHPEFRVAGSHLVLEGRRFGHRPGAHAEPHGATLHVDDRMVPVLPRRRGGQTDNILGLHLPHHLFERESGYVVAFVDDHLAVLSDEVLHFVFSIQALDDGDVYATCPVHFAAADMPDRFGRQIQEHPKALLPLIEQLLPVNHDQSVDLAFRDQPCRNGGLPERRRSAEDAFVVSGDLRDGFLLERPKLTLELRFNRRARVPFVPNFGPDLVRLEKSQRLRQTSTRHGDVLGNSWPHAITRGLSYVESRIA